MIEFSKTPETVLEKDLVPEVNIGIVGHVDHGKTSLVDALMKQSHLFRDNQKEMNENLILDFKSE